MPFYGSQEMEKKAHDWRYVAQRPAETHSFKKIDKIKRKKGRRKRRKKKVLS